MLKRELFTCRELDESCPEPPPIGNLSFDPYRSDDFACLFSWLGPIEQAESGVRFCQDRISLGNSQCLLANWMLGRKSLLLA